MWLRKALADAEVQHDEYTSALNRVALGEIYQEQRQFTNAALLYADAIATFSRLNQVHALAITLRNLAATLPAQGQYRDALVKLDEAVKLAKTIVPADAELEFR